MPKPYKAPDAHIARAVGKRVKLLRIERDMACAAGQRMTQEHLAHAASIGRAALSAIEIGKSNPTIVTLAALCIVLDVPIADLFAAVH